MEDFDLYGDLEEAIIHPTQDEIKRKQAEEDEKHQKNEKLKQKEDNSRAELQRKLDELTEKHHQLNKNFSIMMLTCKNEIER
jgi:hypothetical protein